MKRPKNARPSTHSWKTFSRLTPPWLSHGTLVERLDNTLHTLGQPPVFSIHPLRWLSREVVLCPRPLERLQQLLDEIEPLLDSLETSPNSSGLPEDLVTLFPNRFGEILDFARRILPLALQGKIALLDAAQSAIS
ncbi:MAG: hypothetical protein QM760_09475 [Nibricoccus sp.]